MKVRVLGCSGAIDKDAHTSAFLIQDSILIDAGTGVGTLGLDELSRIDDVFITHSHLDHVAGLGLMIDAVSPSRMGNPLRVHALPETIDALRRYIFNGVIWPDFARLPSPQSPLLRFLPLQTGDTREVDGCLIEALPAQHNVPTVGFAARDRHNDQAPWWVCSGDTGPNPALWQRLNAMNVGALVIETAFSTREQTLAALSCHMTPSDLAQELNRLHAQANFPIFIYHTKPAESEQIMKELNAHAQQRRSHRLPGHDIRWLSEGHLFHF